MIRHTLEGEHLFHAIIKNRGDLSNYKSPWVDLAYSNLKNELSFAEQYHNSFMEMIKTFNEADLENIRIERKEVGQSKTLGDYLNRMVYHEAVHTGQMLGYLRTLSVKCPQIWD
ncbi:DinB family protein [Tenacibaculum sp. 1B UA]|nr:DinB family protein [Tenacibaculum sp. 1B UA]